MNASYELPPLPPILEPYRQQIAESVRPFIRITTEASPNVGIAESKLGGAPYLPLGTEYPKDKNGDDMVLIAQINFAEVPPLAPFPASGILQFYISNSKHYNYGLAFTNTPDENKKQENWRVLWFDTVVTDETLLNTNFPASTAEIAGTPFETKNLPVKLHFELSYSPVAPGDYQIPRVLSYAVTDSYGTPDKQDYAKLDAYSEIFWPSNVGHHLGGYAYFTQTDPRFNAKLNVPSFVLLQLDSDKVMMWGDVGVAHLFISPEDLAARDFSRVYYDWDCN